MKIISTGSYVPQNVLTNAQLEKIVDTTDEWIVSRTGIKERHITSGENTSDLAYKAAINSLENANILPKDIDLIVVATCTPDVFTPSVASHVQRKLGITCMAFDINAACSGFIYGLTIVSGLMQSGKFKYALLIGAETLTKITNWEDRNTCILFGDGAGSVVLRYSKKNNIKYTYCDAKPDEGHVLEAGGVNLYNPYYKQDVTDYHIKMQGQEVFKFAVTVVESSIKKVLEQTNTPIDDIDYFVCHQANARILKKIIKDLNVSENKFYMNLERYGNTSAASIPIALDEMTQKGILVNGNKIIIVGFGAGLTWGAAMVEWS